MELRSVLLVLFFIIELYPQFMVAKDYFKIEYEWSKIEFDFISDEEREESIKNGTFKEGNVQPIDVDVHHPDCGTAEKRIFITCPRIYAGTPATLGIVTDKYRDGNPIITPYPNWGWHTNPEMCKKERIISVFRVFIDNCNRLWVMDNGKIGNNQTCAPQILAFNLKTNHVLRQYEVPFDQHLNTSLYVTTIVESSSLNCEDTFVYNADPSGYSLLVYDFKNDYSWRIVDKTFYPDPKYGTYKIDGTSFEVMDGILGMALSPPGTKRKLFYHAMSSATENWVYTEHLKNESLFSVAFGAPQIFHTYSKTRTTQSVAEAMDKFGNLYFGLLSDIKIATWNTKYPYGNRYFRIVGDNKKTMQFPTGIKVIPDKNSQEQVWIFCTAYHRLATNTSYQDQTNFVMFSAKVTDLLSVNLS